MIPWISPSFRCEEKFSSIWSEKNHLECFSLHEVPWDCLEGVGHCTLLISAPQASSGVCLKLMRQRSRLTSLGQASVEVTITQLSSGSAPPRQHKSETEKSKN